MEGNAWSVSEKYILACDSMSLLIDPKYYDFFTRSLVPMKHYWPVNTMRLCKSINFAINWGNNNTKKVTIQSLISPLLIIKPSMALFNIRTHLQLVLKETAS